MNIYLCISIVYIPRNGNLVHMIYVLLAFSDLSNSFHGVYTNLHSYAEYREFNMKEMAVSTGFNKLMGENRTTKLAKFIHATYVYRLKLGEFLMNIDC